MADWLLWIIALGYLGLLFAVAFAGDRSPGYWRSGLREPLVYALSLAVYCTSWTFYGGVGRAASHGLDFTLIYVGPILVITLGFPMMRKITRVAREQNITSVADFIAARYGKSRVVAAVATLIALVGVLPYLALQLQAVSLSFGALATGPGRTIATPIWADTALHVALTMAVFAILFGVRHVQANERHQGMILAIAFESLVKLGAILAAGVFVTFVMFDGPGDLAARLLSVPELQARLESFAVGPEWVSITVMSALAFLCLPRQFHVGVVESGRPADLRTARWLFPAYLGAINVFVPAFAIAGLLLLGTATDPDLFVLALPMAAGDPLLSLAVFLGGLSAATGMVIVETVALSTMISNELVLPLLLRGGMAACGDGALGPTVLRIRRIAIFAILLLAYAYYAVIGGRLPLASIGLIAFCAVAQLGPALIAGLYWRGAHRHGAFAGMAGGFLVWLVVFLAPTLTDVDWLASVPLLGMEGVLWGIGDHVDALTRGAFWSLSVNTALLVGVSLLARAGERDREQAEAFVGPAVEAGQRPQAAHRAAAFDDLKTLVARFVGPERAEAAFGGAVAALRDRDLADHTERLLSGAIGAASARIMVAATMRRHRTAIGRSQALLREASEAILFNRDLLSATLDNIGQGIGVFDRDLHLAAWNRRFVEILGLAEPRVAIGMPLAALAAPGQGGAFGLDLSVLLEEQRDPERRRRAHSHERRGSDGRVLELQTNPMPDGGFVLVCTDVTERVKTLDALRDSERRIRIYTDNVPVLIAYVDREERYRFTNRPYEQALGLERGETNGLPIRVALGEDRYARLKPYIDAALAGRRQVFEIEFAAAGAELARGTYIPHRDEQGRVIGFFTLYHDITEQRRAEAVLRETAETLERRVAERTRELTALNEALAAAKAAAEAANLSKTRFLAAASHDLLQPFHAARLLTATLAERLGRRPEASLVGHIDSSLGTVEELLQALLEISKLDAGAFEPQPRAVTADEILRAAVLPFEPIARRRGLRLRIAPSTATVQTDPALVRRIVQNFVSNAVRYTRQGTVLVGCRRRAGALVIQVWDTGPGIPQEQLSAIFEEFRRLGSGSEDEPAGLGLGLAIVERIAARLGHRVAVRSWPGRGSVFEVVLPLAETQATVPPPAAPRPRVPATDLAGRLVLCVDNDHAILTATRLLLEGWGCTVVAATDAAGAKEALQPLGRMPDMVLLDYHLAGAETGLDVLAALEAAAGRPLPAALVTADRTEALKAAARARGLPLLHKPLKPAALRALLVQRLASRRAPAETPPAA
ncbi:hybrid sensor histidine kinase/response regulator [Inquilinus limosus]|uniref:hybrid sensor histidine kinase/response regulator n=1 Tax=Inquilinus limosus TaxID=171674 RepID=UPI0004024B2B|nr:NahK/ErcS family hybrid sensor histidine kinase/response regulator [Inquilinus limosus]